MIELINRVLMFCSEEPHGPQLKQIWTRWI
jgi:hypothetical protein